jgi:2,3-diaminopropionate biosynthesis protein SbnB
VSEATFVFLSQEDVVAAGGLEIGPTIEAVAEALRLHAKGETILPHKPTIRWSEDLDSEEREGRIMAMPAYVGGSFDVAGLKWIPSVPSNPSRGLPRGIGLIVLTARGTGLPLAIMDGTVVSAMRTAAVTGIACRLLASPDARVVALLGAGAQARTQLLALEHELPALEEVVVFDVAPGRAEAFRAREGTRHAARLTVAPSAEEACRAAQVVVPVTIAPEPYIPAAWLAEGSLFVSISSLDPMVEVLRAADVLVCDDWEHETGHPARPFARAVAERAVAREQVGELGELLIGSKPGRTSPSERVFVSPVGLAIEDVAAAHRVWRRALDEGIGTRLDLWRTPIWA